MTRSVSRLILTICWGSVLLGWPLCVAAQDDFIVILDQSASMRERQPGDPSSYHPDPLQAPKSREAVRAINEVVTTLLREGDYFVLITFGNRAEVGQSQVLHYRHERDLMQRYTQRLPFRDTKTDITAGLKAARDVLEQLNTPERRKILVLITDGMNDPPPDSLYRTRDQQLEILKNFRELIRFHRWNVNLVGLGLHTDIGKLAEDLGLPAGKVLTLDSLTQGRIETGLSELFKREQRAMVSMRPEAGTTAQEPLQVGLTPRLLGGYSPGVARLVLTSEFDTNVDVHLKTNAPVTWQGPPGVEVEVAPLAISLAPRQPQMLTLSLGFKGARPEMGRLEIPYAFDFAEGSVPFYPRQGSVEVTLPSWWEYYGTLALIAIVVVLLALVALAWMLRRARVPEVRVEVTTANGVLGQPMTLRVGEQFVIANSQFEGRSVPASGLTCKTAATVRYLGRRTFEVIGEEASIMRVDGRVDRLSLGFETPFDLKDQEGKMLRDIMLSTPGQRGDMFAGRSATPFS